MQRAPPSAADAADLEQCATEPIHIPGAIQPRGALLALDGEAAVITQTAGDCAGLVGREPQQLQGLALASLFGEELAQQVRDARARWRRHLGRPAAIRRLRLPADMALCGHVHESDGILILEIAAEFADPDTDQDADRYRQALQRFERVGAEPDLDAKLARAVTAFRAISGYDRVMIYRFDRDWNGQVIAEAREPSLEPYLGLHYPASDIPVQARRLYRLSPIRVIVDIADRPAPLVPRLSPVTGRELDLSLSVLRSVSPVHLEYLGNMGVRATMTASLLRDGELWGLVACHHMSPKAAGLAERELMEYLTHDLSTQIALAEEQRAARQAARFAGFRDRVVRAMRKGLSIADLLADPYLDDLLAAVGADGVALIRGGEVVAAGRTPDAAALTAIDRDLRAVLPSGGSALFATECLSEQIPWTDKLADAAAGLILQPLAEDRETQFMWLRGEQSREVSWGGDPRKATSVGEGGRISPRKSFAAWKEIVRLRCKPWSEQSLSSAKDLSALIDIELRRLAEQSLHVALTKYRTLFETLPLGIAVVDTEGKVTEANPAFARVLGAERAERLRANLSAPIWANADGAPPPGDSPLAGAVRREQRLSGLELSMPAENDETRWVSVTSTPLAAEGLGAVTTYEDITLRRQAEAARESEAALRESERRFRNIANELPVVVWMHDAGGACSFVSKTALTFSGTDESALTGSGWLDIVHPDDRQRYGAAFQACVETRQPFHDVMRARRGDGDWRWLESFARPLFSPEGTFAGMVGISIDITDRKTADEALRLSHAALEQRSAQLQRLTSQLTHAEQRERERLAKLLHDHMQQLLVGLAIAVGRLRRHLDHGGERGQTDEILAGMDQMVREATDTARNMVADLIPPILNESGLADALRWLARNMSERHDLDLRLALDDAMSPACDEVRRVLYEAVREALLNVVKHADCGRARIELSRAGEDRLKIVVEDEGIGFDTDVLRSRAPQATGLGLLSMRERLSLLGGSCDIRSTEGLGTRVILLAPLGDAPLGEAAPADLPNDLPPTEPASAEPPAGDIRILLVDDHAVIRQGLLLMLEEEPGLAVVGEAATGEEAIALVARLRPNLVLMDYSMPGMDGLETTRRIKARWPDTQVIGLSMYEDIDLADAMIAAGASAYVTKTASGTDLLRTIHRSIRQPGSSARRG